MAEMAKLLSPCDLSLSSFIGGRFPKGGGGCGGREERKEKEKKVAGPVEAKA